MNLPLVPIQRRMVGGTIRVFLADALLVPTGFIITVFLTRQLGPSDYGLFALAAALMVWVEAGVTSLFNRATVKFVSQARDWKPVGTTVARLYLAISIGTMLLLWLLATPIATLLKEPVLATYLRLFALDIPKLNLRLESGTPSTIYRRVVGIPWCNTASPQLVSTISKPGTSRKSSGSRVMPSLRICLSLMMVTTAGTFSTSRSALTAVLLIDSRGVRSLSVNLPIRSVALIVLCLSDTKIELSVEQFWVSINTSSNVYIGLICPTLA